MRPLDRLFLIAMFTFSGWFFVDAMRAAYRHAWFDAIGWMALAIIEFVWAVHTLGDLNTSDDNSNNERS